MSWRYPVARQHLPAYPTVCVVGEETWWLGRGHRGVSPGGWALRGLSLRTARPLWGLSGAGVPVRTPSPFSYKTHRWVCRCRGGRLGVLGWLWLITCGL